MPCWPGCRRRRRNWRGWIRPNTGWSNCRTKLDALRGRGRRSRADHLPAPIGRGQEARPVGDQGTRPAGDGQGRRPCPGRPTRGRPVGPRRGADRRSLARRRAGRGRPGRHRDDRASRCARAADRERCFRRRAVQGDAGSRGGAGRRRSGRDLVFDEVDAGVGGRAASEIGSRLAALARSHQVIVVTHLAQVAAYADRHFVVDASSGGRVGTSDVRLVAGDDREVELARMLGGTDGATARAHARDLIGTAAGPVRSLSSGRAAARAASPADPCCRARRDPGSAPRRRHRRSPTPVAT